MYNFYTVSLRTSLSFNFISDPDPQRQKVPDTTGFGSTTLPNCSLCPFTGTGNLANNQRRNSGHKLESSQT